LVFGPNDIHAWRYVALHNHAGAIVDSQFYTHIISISEWLSIGTLVVSFWHKLISSWCHLVFGPNVVHAWWYIVLLNYSGAIVDSKNSYWHHFYVKMPFLAVPLLLRASDNSFHYDAVWFLTQMFLFMLTICCPA
jgi:hypothetical protein